MTAAIIVAAGSSRRMGFDKLLAPLDGKPVLQHSIEAFLAVDEIQQIVVVCPEDRWSQLGKLPGSKAITRVDGGNERQHSVENGLNTLPPGITHVAVHDGARPLVAADDIRRCIKAAHACGAATLARRATETMKRADADDFCLEAVCREHLWSMETPQVFEIERLLQAYRHVAEQGLQVTDEVSALQAIGQPVKFIESLQPNLKITTPADLRIAEAMLRIED